MAFSVSYTRPDHWQNERWHRAAPKGISPYDDWIRNGCPSVAAFKYTDQIGRDNLIDNMIWYIYDPNLRALYINFWFDYYIMTAVMTITVDHKNKALCIRDTYCRADDHWPTMNGEGCPNGEGTATLLRKALNWNSNLDPLNKIAAEFFGKEWKFLGVPKKSNKTEEWIIKEMEYWQDALSYKEGQWDMTIAYFDKSFVEEAATTIQAAFRGWSARMKYRFNPYTRLGRFVVLKDAGFI